VPYDTYKLLYNRTMNRNTVIIAALVVAFTAGASYYLWMTSHTVVEMDHGEDHKTQQEPVPQILPAEQIAKLERQFINDMIPHHEEAVAAAQNILYLGVANDEVRALATDIVKAQEAEIASMKEWHLAWYGEVYKDTGTYMPMMRDSASVPSTERDKAFLEDMIQHHLHALAMVQDSAPQFVRPELKELSQNIASSQSNEVVAMKILLRQL
jgi:uncharacterized protein (DUF305 family)